jgi:hypothetical protein
VQLIRLALAACVAAVPVTAMCGAVDMHDREELATQDLAVAVATVPAPQVIEEAAVATAPAVRLEIPTTTSTVAVAPAPVPTGLNGLPFAPEGLSDCDEMAFYRVQAGLPDRFQALGWRESNCRNEDQVRTFCCHGYWQMYTSLHVRDHRLAPRMAACGVFSHHDLNSDDPLEKQRQACAAKALFDVVGYSAWSL